MTREEAGSRIQEALNLLVEHFGHGQIVCSWNEEGMTHSKRGGFGDWYARQGLCREFIVQDQAQDFAAQIVQKLNESDRLTKGDDDFPTGTV